MNCRCVIVIILLALTINATAQKAKVPETINYYKAQSDANIPTDHESVLHGQKLFSNQCAECHEFCKQKTGPSLSSVTDRRPLPWLLDFIKSSQTVIGNGDEYAQYLYNSYSHTVMPDFRYLSDEEILDILAYIRQESSAPNRVSGVNSGATNATEIDKHEANLNKKLTEEEQEDRKGYEEYEESKLTGFKIGILMVIILTVAAGLYLMFSIWKKTSN
ncbi:c-type cytochrome [Fulvivirga sediminis]|uniref:Cytochrome c n=1 Tax=Fulvivirga sediminis TaxID=2803949 RepID=A0A937F6L9_9BACT|nr:cytochrome c [Fulvivirga sediminis]MBL3655219.1 cytochrome c [Fulvivirga sediminis]